MASINFMAKKSKLDEESEYKQPETNVEFLTRVMNSDPMIQLVVMSAIISHCDVVMKDPKAYITAIEKHTPMFSGAGYVAGVQRLQTEFDNRHKKGKE